MSSVGTDELAQIEVQDSQLRWQEGGGSQPSGNYYGGQPLANLGQADEWYKNPQYLTIIGIGAAALLLVCLMSRKD